MKEHAEAVDDASPQALATAIERLLADAGRRDDIATAALAFARAHDVHWSVDALLRLYEAAGARGA